MSEGPLSSSESYGNLRTASRQSKYVETRPVSSIRRGRRRTLDALERQQRESKISSNRIFAILGLLLGGLLCWAYGFMVPAALLFVMSVGALVSPFTKNEQARKKVPEPNAPDQGLERLSDLLEAALDEPGPGPGPGPEPEPEPESSVRLSRTFMQKEQESSESSEPQGPKAACEEDFKDLFKKGP